MDYPELTELKALLAIAYNLRAADQSVAEAKAKAKAKARLADRVIAELSN